MRRSLPLLCLGLGFVQAGGVVGASLPAPYQMRKTVATGQRQVILATGGRPIDSPVIPGDKTLNVTSLLLLRDVRSGHTVWKRYLGDQYELDAVSPTAIELTNIEGPRKWVSWYSLQDGKFIGRAVLTTATATP